MVQAERGPPASSSSEPFSNIGGRSRDVGPMPRTDARSHDLIAALLATIYVVFWTSTAYLMERAYSLRVWDVGANYVLTNMSSPPGLDYGHLRSAPQNLIYLLFTPLVRAFPDPMTLVYAEDVLMGVAAFFVYLIAAHVWQSRAKAVLVEGLFLFSYALFRPEFTMDRPRAVCR